MPMILACAACTFPDVTYGSKDSSLPDDAADTDSYVPPIDAAAYDGPTSLYDGPLDPNEASCDRDKDGYLAAKAGCDAGSPDAVDCDDLDSRAHPGADFLTDLPTMKLLGDWNCNGIIEPQYPSVSCGLTSCSAQGFYRCPRLRRQRLVRHLHWHPVRGRPGRQPRPGVQMSVRARQSPR